MMWRERSLNSNEEEKKMSKMKFNVINIVCSLLLALSIVSLFRLDVRAEYINDEVNGVSYDDEESVSVKYSYDYARGGGGYTYIWLENEGDRIANVKSSSKNLIAKKTYESKSVETRTDLVWDEEKGEYVWDEEKGEYVYETKTTTSYRTAFISYFAKKAGSYKVTFDVIKADGTKRCTKTIKVKTYGTTVSPVKSIKYAGKEFYNYYPYTTKTSGKLSVKMSSNYKLVSIEVGTLNSKGERVYKKVKNNKTIKLAKTAKYTYKYDYEQYDYDELFPSTYIKITYQNKKTKEKDYTIYSLETINKK